MRDWVWKLSVAVLVIALPVLVSWSYHRWTALPEEVVLATGPSGGRYEALSNSLAEVLREEFDVVVRTVPSEGSLDNLQLLRSGEVDFALYQHGAESLRERFGVNPAIEAEADAGEQPVFVANLYSEVAQVVVHNDAILENAGDWSGKRIAVGREGSGDYAFSLLLLEHLGLSLEEIEPLTLSYTELPAAFRKGTVDAAIVTTAPRSPVVLRLLAGDEAGACRLRSIPYAEALASRELIVSTYTVPTALYRSQPTPEPPEPVRTVALRAQLLARRDVPSSLVEAATAIVLREQFQKENGLGELFHGGASFASEKPEFAVHPAALHVYEPELKPLLNTDFVEATEGIRSFVVSLLIASYLGFRWWRHRMQRSKEHHLDRYIRQVLEIERRQLDFDQTPDSDDSPALQELLDDVTHLRQEALGEFTAHEINEDPAIDSFVEMCHALSDKINAKLTRQRLANSLKRIEGLVSARSLGDDAPEA